MANIVKKGEENLDISFIIKNGIKISKRKINGDYEKPFCFPMIYSDGTEPEPFYSNLGYGFLETDKLKVASFVNNSLEYIPVSSFKINKIPVKVEGVYRTNLQKQKAKLIGYNSYFLTDSFEPIKSLYYWDDDSVWEKKLTLKTIESEAKIPLMIYDNSFSKFHELLREYSMPEFHFLCRKKPEFASEEEIKQFELENRKQLDEFYKYCDEISKKINDNMKTSKPTQNKLKTLEDLIVSQQKSFDKPKIIKTDIRKQNQKQKLIMWSWELEKCMLYTIYKGDNNYSNQLVKWNFQENFDTNTMEYQLYDINVDNGKIEFVPLQKYKRTFTNDEFYATTDEDFLGEAEIFIVENYNIVEAKELLPILNQNYGEKDYYTIEEISGLLNLNTKESKEKKLTKAFK